MTKQVHPIFELLEEDTRYKLEGYQFIRDALQYTQENLEFESDIESEEDENHLTGQQLCEGTRQYAIDQYGLLAKRVLNSWGIYSTSDFGEMVYNLIRIEQMRKSKDDRREDFNDVFDFETAFSPEFKSLVD